MDDNAIKISFIEEAQQVIAEMEILLLDLEQNPDSQETIDGIFRGVHNIKGSARAVGFEQLGEFCHSLETDLLAVKSGEQLVTKPVIDQLLNSSDLIKAALVVYQFDLNADFDFTLPLKSSIEEEVPAGAAANGSLVIREKKAATGDTAVRVNLKSVDKLINAVGELVVLDTVLRQQAQTDLNSSLLKTSEQIGKIIREVQDLAMSLRMVPAKPLIQKLQRICRDTSSDLSKSLNFRITGEEIEIDKTILDGISDPLVHLVRNAIDHGLEEPAARKAAGKNATGDVHLSLTHEGGKLLVRLKDDGRGLDHKKIAAKALEKGLISSVENLSESRICDLIFEAGFSTKANVTAVSGRGVGMDVVRTAVENLGGQIEIFSVPDQGTEFVISLPLTVAIIEGMVVSTAKARYIVPFTQVSETVRINDEELSKGSESGTMLRLRGQHLPVYSLTELLEGRKAEKMNGIGIIAKSARVNFIVLVDDVLRQQQVVVKQLGAELSGFKRFVGSGVLGDGKPALILDLVQLADEELKRKRM